MSLTNNFPSYCSKCDAWKFVTSWNHGLYKYDCGHETRADFRALLNEEDAKIIKQETIKMIEKKEIERMVIPEAVQYLRDGFANG